MLHNLTEMLGGYNPAPTLLLTMLAVPLVAAVVVALLGPGRAELVRGVSLVATLVAFALAVAVATFFVTLERHSLRTFQPEIVPGAAPDQPHETSWAVLSLGSGVIQFFVGIDGLN